MFMIGSFAGGLWGGASSALNLYSAYQGIQVNQMALDRADAAKQMLLGDEANANVEGYQPGMKPAGIDMVQKTSDAATKGGWSDPTGRNTTTTPPEQQTGGLTEPMRYDT